MTASEKDKIMGRALWLHKIATRYYENAYNLTSRLAIMEVLCCLSSELEFLNELADDPNIHEMYNDVLSLWGELNKIKDHNDSVWKEAIKKEAKDV